MGAMSLLCVVLVVLAAGVSSQPVEPEQHKEMSDVLTIEEGLLGRDDETAALHDEEIGEAEMIYNRNAEGEDIYVDDEDDSKYEGDDEDLQADDEEEDLQLDDEKKAEANARNDDEFFQSGTSNEEGSMESYEEMLSNVNNMAAESGESEESAESGESDELAELRESEESAGLEESEGSDNSKESSSGSYENTDECVDEDGNPQDCTDDQLYSQNARDMDDKAVDEEVRAIVAERHEMGQGQGIFPTDFPIGGGAVQVGRMDHGIGQGIFPTDFPVE